MDRPTIKEPMSKGIVRVAIMRPIPIEERATVLRPYARVMYDKTSEARTTYGNISRTRSPGTEIPVARYEIIVKLPVYSRPPAISAPSTAVIGTEQKARATNAPK
jgi:hypothetical protein